MVTKNAYTLLETNKKLFIRSFLITGTHTKYSMWDVNSIWHAMSQREHYVRCTHLLDEKIAIKNVIGFAFWKQAGLHSIYDTHIVNWDLQ